MKKCKLCKINEANRKGSHIIPHFLLRRIENIDGEKDRDYEMGFSVSPSNITSHFGRSLQPEKLAEMYGVLSDSEIEKNKNPSIVDFYFCSTCEDRLAKIENLYAGNINKDVSVVSSIVGGLFWMTIFWRMSIHPIYGMILKKSEMEMCRSYINTHIDNISNNIYDQAITDKRAKKISYQFLKFSKETKCDNELLHFCLNLKNPYIIFMGEFLILFSLKNNWNGEVILKKEFDINVSMNDNSKNKLTTGRESRFVLPNNVRVDIYNKLVNLSSKLRIQELRKMLDLFSSNVTEGRVNIMPEELKQEIITNMGSSGFSARNWTNESLGNSIRNVFADRGYINLNELD